jgi:hypothetical protein
MFGMQEGMVNDGDICFIYNCDARCKAWVVVIGNAKR